MLSLLNGYNRQRDRRRAPANAFDSYRSFYTDPIRETGLARNQAASVMKSCAIAKPAEYNNMRMELVEKLSFELTQQLYDVVFAALGKGTDMNGTYLIKFGAGGNEIDPKYNRGRSYFEPLIPEKEVSRIAYKAATGLVSIIEKDVVEHICPSSFTAMANKEIGAEVNAKIKAGRYDANFADE